MTWAVSRLVSLCICLTFGMGSVAAVHAQGVSGETGAIRITATALPSEQPLPYAVVSIPTLGIERFTDAQGRALLTGVAVGSHELVVRRIGFSRYARRVEVMRGQELQIAARLERIPQRLSRVTVRGSTRCRNPGLPDSLRAPEVAELVSLLRENADRYRLLATQYPFKYLQARALGVAVGQRVTMRLIDSLTISSVAKATYRPGELIQTSRNADGTEERTLIFPTILDLVDSAFSNTHCYEYAGAVKRNGETWRLLDVRVDEALMTSDVDARFYIDSATSGLRQMDLSLTRASSLPPESRRIQTLTATTSFFEIASGIAIINKTCALTTFWSFDNSLLPSHPFELQQLLYYEFTKPLADVAPSGYAFSPIGWMREQSIPPSIVPCLPR